MKSYDLSNLLKHLRGYRTQKEMALLLDITYNKYFKIESGYQPLSLELFINICAQTNIDFSKTLFDYYNVSVVKLDQVNIISSLLKFWLRESEKSIYEQLGYTKSKWWRIKTGKSKISFSDFASLLKVMIGRSNNLLECFDTSNTRIDELSPEKIIEMIKEFPEFSSIIAIGRTTSFFVKKTNEDKMALFSAGAKISQERLLKISNGLLKHGLDIYNVNSFKPWRINIARIDFDTHHRIANHVLETHLSCYESNDSKKDGIVNVPIVSAISSKNLKAVNEALTRCMNDIIELLHSESDEEKDQVTSIYLGAVSSQFQENKKNTDRTSNKELKT